MKRFGRLPFALAALLALMLGAVGAARVYLSSPAAARRVASSLQTLLNPPVAVGSAVIALGGASPVPALTLGPPDDPYLVVPLVTADLTAWGAARGASPDRLTLTGAHLTLRF